MHYENNTDSNLNEHSPTTTDPIHYTAESFNQLSKNTLPATALIVQYIIQSRVLSTAVMGLRRLST